MNFLTQAETASPADPTKSSPTDNASARPDIPSTIVVSVLLLAELGNSPSKEDALFAP